MPLIDQDDYPQIRAALGTDITEGDVPNSMIALDLFSGEAMRWAESQITVSGSEAIGPRAKLAAIYMTAALLAPSVAQVLSQKDSTGESITIKSFDPIKKEAYLRERAADMIALVNSGNVIELSERPSSAVRPMSSCITVLCPTHRVPRNNCGCGGAVLVF